MIWKLYECVENETKTLEYPVQSNEEAFDLLWKFQTATKMLMVKLTVGPKIRVMKISL